MVLIEKELTDKAISAFYDVYYDLGYGFLESVYQNALYKELMRRGYACEVQMPIHVYHKDEVVGKFFADILVNRRIILELKSVECITDIHEAQLMNYLRATDIEVGIIFNFGPKPTFIRKILTNEYKQEYNRNRIDKFKIVNDKDIEI